MLSIHLLYNPEILIDIYPKELKTQSLKDLCMNVHSIIIQNNGNHWKQYKCPSTSEGIKSMNIGIVEYYSAVKRTEFLIHVTPWQDLNNINKRSLIQKTAYDMISLILNFKTVATENRSVMSGTQGGVQDDCRPTWGTFLRYCKCLKTGLQCLLNNCLNSLKIIDPYTGELYLSKSIKRKQLVKYIFRDKWHTLKYKT